MQLKFRGKVWLMTYDHLYCRLDYHEMKEVQRGRLAPFVLTAENLDIVNASPALHKMLGEQPGFIDGYGFKDADGNIVGVLYLMKKGGTEVLYRIRHIDAYLFAVRVFREYWGHGYAAEMAAWVMDTLHERGVDQMYLTVKRQNTQAIRAYEKLGFKVIGRRRFVRIGHTNIPYYSL